MTKQTITTPAVTIRAMTNADADFYRLIGPFLARRAVVKEMGGYPLWDEDGKRWFVALDHDGQVVAFASLMMRGEALWLDDAYVLPAWRGQGLYRQLLDMRLAHCPAEAVVRMTSLNPQVIAALGRRDFVVEQHRGRWAWMRRAPMGVEKRKSHAGQ